MPIQHVLRAVCAPAVVAACLAAPLVFSAAARADLIIDDFSDIEKPSQWPVVLTNIGSSTISETGLSGVLGGSRTTTIFADDLAEPGLDDVTVTVAAALGKLDYASTVGAEGSLNLSYNAPPLRGGGFDLSGESQLEVQFLLFDHSGGQDLPVTITLYDDDENSIELTQSLTAPGPQTLIFELSSFTRGGVFDLSNVTAIDVFFDGALATDFRIEEIRTVIVPAPATVALLSVVAAGRRRRRRSSR